MPGPSHSLGKIDLEMLKHGLETGDGEKSEAKPKIISIGP